MAQTAKQRPKLQNTNRSDEIHPSGKQATLNSLSGLSQKNPNEFALFSHHKLLQEGKELVMSYKALREACLELFLSVKIRDDTEIEDYNASMYRREKQELDPVNGFELIDMIKESIEKLMQMHEQQNAEFAEEDSTQQDVLIDSAVVNMHFNHTNEKQSVSSSIKDMEK